MRQDDVVRAHAVVLGQAPEGDRVLLRKLEARLRLLDEDERREVHGVAPIELEYVDRLRDAFEVDRAERPAALSTGARQLAKRRFGEPDRGGIRRRRNTGAEVHGVAGDHLAVDQDRTEVNADTDLQVVFRGTRLVRLDDTGLMPAERKDRLIDRGEAKERSVAGRVDDAPLRFREPGGEKVEVPLLEGAARVVAEAGKVRGGPDDVAECDRHPSLEPPLDVLAQRLAETDHLGEGQPAEVNRRTHETPA